MSAIAGLICGAVAGLFIGDIVYGAICGTVVGIIIDPTWPL